ncbi:hypothetical protein [Ferrimonas balearica]|uniref:hypothetical protein n=1 Tax=Ferrimonas balearica TaxID=44012 RepID=UPI001C57A36B|nr:hypothetical protein [Ferrimonas balearica]MBW3164782.1 hypothetical protein [Ferrimonas balearica]
MAITLHRTLLLSLCLLAPSALANEAKPAEAGTLPPAMLAACEQLKSGDACTIIGPTGLETGGVCMKHPETKQLFCQPEGMPDTVILQQPTRESPPDPGQ